MAARAKHPSNASTSPAGKGLCTRCKQPVRTQPTLPDLSVSTLPRMNSIDPISPLWATPATQILPTATSSLVTPLYQHHLFLASSLHRTWQLIDRLKLKLQGNEQSLSDERLSKSERNKLLQTWSKTVKALKLAQEEAIILDKTMKECELKIRECWDSQLRQSLQQNALYSPLPVTWPASPLSSVYGPGVGTGLVNPSTLNLKLNTAPNMDLPLPSMPQTPYNVDMNSPISPTSYGNSYAYGEQTGYQQSSPVQPVWTRPQFPSINTTLSPQSSISLRDFQDPQNPPDPQDDDDDGSSSKSPLRAEASSFKPFTFQPKNKHLFKEDVPESPMGTQFPLSPKSAENSDRKPKYSAATVDLIQYRLANSPNKKRHHRNSNSFKSGINGEGNRTVRSQLTEIEQ